MTAELHRQSVLDFLDVYFSGDVEGALERCTDDIEFLVNAPIDILPHLGSRHGKAAVREVWTTINARYTDMRYEVPIMVAEGDKVATHIRTSSNKRSNARVVKFDVAVFYTLRDGKISQIRQIFDTFDLVEQVLERDVTAVLNAEESGKN